MKSRKFKCGDRVRMTKELKVRMRGRCRPNHHVEPLDIGSTDDGCMKCSTNHVEEFGECIGLVEDLDSPSRPEINVRWQPSGLRYAYNPKDLELIK